MALTAQVVTGKHVAARITSRIDHTDDLWSIRIRSDTGFAFKPGQYATLGVRHGDKVLERPYSIVSSPHESEVEFLLELVPDGLVTPHLHRLTVGDELLMRPRAKGLFVLDLGSGRSHHLMLCTVTGVAPFVSMLRELVRGDRPEPVPAGVQVTMVHGSSRSVEFGYAEELGELAALTPWFHYVPTVSRPWEDPGWRGERGRVEDVMRKYADQARVGPDNGVVYLCGHPGMITVGQAMFHRVGFDPKLVRQEEYWPLGKEPLDQDERIQSSPQDHA